MSGWLIAVLMDTGVAQPPLRVYFAVGLVDRSRAEWAAVDQALRTGSVAASPAAGQEPVEALREFTAARMKSLGLAPGEVRELGWKHPRRWLSG